MAKSDNAGQSDTSAIDELSVSSVTWEGFAGIASAGALYAIGFGLILTALSLGSTVNVQGADIVLLLFVPIALLLAGFIGFMYSGLLGMIALMLVTTFNWTMGHQFKSSTIGGIAGGMAGYFSLCFVLFGPGNLLGFLLGPFLAMLLGQTGAIYMIRYYESVHRYRNRNKALKLREEMEAIVALHSKIGNPVPVKENETPELTEAEYVHPLDRDDDDAIVRARPKSKNVSPKKLSIRKLFVLTAWVGAFFGFAGAVGAVNGVVGILVGAYLIAQTMAFAIGIFIQPLIERRLNRRVRIELTLQSVRKEPAHR